MAKYTRKVRAGAVEIGGGAPVTVQSMTTTDTKDTAATLEQVRKLTERGCELVRVSIPDRAALKGFRELRKELPDVALVADIHFNHRLATGAIDAGADKVRINPGNLGGKEKFREVLHAARERKVVVRVGVNAGSLEPELIDRYGGVCVEGVVESGLSWTAFAEDCGHSGLVLSCKLSNPMETVAANRLLAKRTDVALHLGVTESGPQASGLVRSSVALGILLSEGIGDTIRISLAADPLLEVDAAWELLRATGLRRRGVEIVACPTCARAGIDVLTIAGRLKEELVDVTADISVAVMGCVVNGPGESIRSDVGVAGGGGKAMLYTGGDPVRRIGKSEIVKQLVAEVRALAGERG